MALFCHSRQISQSLMIFVLCAASNGQNPATSFSLSTIAGGPEAGDGRAATAALLRLPNGVAADAFGNVIIADSAMHRVRKVSLDGRITTIAGTGTPGFSGDGAAATSARLNTPYGVATEPGGAVIVADLANKRVRRIDYSGKISTVAGGGSTVAGEVAIPALEAQLEAPRNVAVDSSGNIYVSDFYGHSVYKVTPFGMLLRVAGTGQSGSVGDVGIAQRTQLSYPAGIAISSTGVLYIADTGSRSIKMVERGGISALPWTFAQPLGLSMNGSVLLISDKLGTGAPPLVSTIRLVHAVDAVVGLAGRLIYSDGKAVWAQSGDSDPVPFAGGPDSGGYGDDGPATAAYLGVPAAVALDGRGGFLIADWQESRVRYVDAKGIIHTAVGASAGLSSPRGVASLPAGGVIVSDAGHNRVVDIGASGEVTSSAEFNVPDKIARHPDGRLCVAVTGEDRIACRTADGTWATFATVPAPRGLAADTAGNFYTVSARQVLRVEAGGSIATVLSGGPVIDPVAVAVDPAGNLFVADTGAHTVWMVSASGTVQPIAGIGQAGFTEETGPASSNALDTPSDVAVLADGSLLVCDAFNGRVRRLSANVVAPPPLLTALVNAASRLEGPLAPGELIVVPSPDAAAEIFFDGSPASVIDANPEHLMVQVPLTLVPGSTTHVEIRGSGQASVTLNYPVVSHALGLFAVGNRAFAVHQDGAFNSIGSPARQNMIVSVFGTGDGVMDVPLGFRIAGVDAEILYAGPAPGLTGIFQINARIPGGFLPSGPLTVLATAGEATSQPGLTLWVD
ncbi:MAG: hypothetical protein ABI693_02845 [Bryobacteraceae bacterium]